MPRSLNPSRVALSATALTAAPGRMTRRREQAQVPWFVWLAFGVDPLTAAFVLAPNTIQLTTD